MFEIYYIKKDQLKSEIKEEIPDSFKSEKRSLEYNLGRKIIKYVLETYKIKNQTILVKDNKPYIQGNPIHFSISHSKNIVLVAFSDTPVGVDIEYITDRNFEKLYERYNLPPEKRNKESFFSFWTEFEAKIKLHYNPSSIYTTKFLKNYSLTICTNVVTDIEKELKIFELVQADDSRFQKVIEPNCKGLKPHINTNSEILILGSMPGKKSLDEKKYYANPQNRFWKIMGEFCDCSDMPELDYSKKIDIILKHGFALWDVLESCERSGSLDTEIKNAQPNDIHRILKNYPKIKVIGLNGGFATNYFQKHFKDITKNPEYKCIPLPSSSGSNTRYKTQDLIKHWEKLYKKEIKC